jgi:hypothetical protein
MGTVVEFKPHCCICDRRMRRYEGNNPYPVMELGENDLPIRRVLLCCPSAGIRAPSPIRLHRTIQPFAIA